MTQESPTPSPTNPSHGPLDPSLLEILVCPVTRSRLRLEGDFLVGEVGGLRYPIRDGIPVLLPQEAELPAGIASLEDFKARFAPPSRINP